MTTPPQLDAVRGTVGIQDRRPGCIDIGHQPSGTGVPVRVVPFRKEEIAGGELFLTHALHIDAKVSK